MKERKIYLNNALVVRTGPGESIRLPRHTALTVIKEIPNGVKAYHPDTEEVDLVWSQFEFAEE